MIRIKNNKNIVDTWCGMMIEPAAYYELETFEIPRWGNNSKVLSDIGSGNLIVNDGVVDITDISTAITKLKGEAPTDNDGRVLTRQVAAASGWKAQFHAIRISTSTIDGVHNKNKAGNDLGFCTYIMYDVNDQVTVDIAQCVKTVVTWEPTHDMEIIGGRMFQRTAPTTDIWMYVTSAAHISTQYGGSVAFAEGGINLYDVGDGGEADFDGRASKFISYDTIYHSGRFEILLKHDAGVQHKFSILFELFKP